jgi:hypothetical protein
MTERTAPEPLLVEQDAKQGNDLGACRKSTNVGGVSCKWRSIYGLGRRKVKAIMGVGPGSGNREDFKFCKVGSDCVPPAERNISVGAAKTVIHPSTFPHPAPENRMAS